MVMVESVGRTGAMEGEGGTNQPCCDGDRWCCEPEGLESFDDVFVLPEWWRIRCEVMRVNSKILSESVPQSLYIFPPVPQHETGNPLFDVIAPVVNGILGAGLAGVEPPPPPLPWPPGEVRVPLKALMSGLLALATEL